MSKDSEIRANVTKSTDVLIRGISPDINLTAPFYAINWFSTKREWLYNFYNLLAGRSVIKIGGKAFFKAKVSDTIVDETGNGKRDLLLIVSYPGGLQFKSLMESTYFKLVSIFRVFSVRKFTFGFTHKIEAETTSQKSDNLHYAIHYFKVSQGSTETIQKIKELLPQHIVVKYAGNTIANLFKHEKDKEAEQVPNLMSGLVLLQAGKEEDLRNLFHSEAYKEILKQSGHNFIGLLNRIF